MITPAVLIMAVGSFLISTSQRLARSIDRSRDLLERLRLANKNDLHIYSDEEISLFKRLLMKSTTRCRLLQRSMLMLYVALMFFILTSIIIGFSFLVEWKVQWVSIITGLGGVVLLFISAILLIIDSRIAVGSINEETNWTRQIHTNWHAGPDSKT